MNPFALQLPPRTRFGRGASVAAAPEIASFGRRIHVVHGRSHYRAVAMIEALESRGCDITSAACPTEPTLAMLETALAETRADPPDLIVAIGGGAALDLGKALAALTPSGGPPPDYLEGVGSNRPLDAPPLPFVAIPTTAGTGSEATKNAVIAVPDQARKVSLRDDRMVPALAIVDPALTDGTPAPQTLASGMDAVVQVIEPYLSARATPFTDALVRPAIATGLGALVTLMERGEDPAARDDLAYVAYVSGIALANAGLGAVHGLAGVLGGETGGAHGVICARLLPSVLDALQGADIGAVTRSRLHEVRSIIDETVPAGFDGLHGWMSRHGLPDLPRIDVTSVERVALASAKASSMAASPVRLGADTLSRILHENM
jgi:alcohol dehydrogenase class IV